MRSGISFFDRTLFKKDVTRFWPIWASHLVIWVFALPVNLMIHPGNFEDTVLKSLTAVLILTVPFALFAAMAVLSHLYSPRAANFFGGLPIRREGQFVTQYLAGFSFLAAPELVVAGLTAVVLAVRDASSLGAVPLWLTVAVGEAFFFYSLAILCGLFTGHILVLPAFYIIFNFLALGLGALLSELARHFYFGFVSFGSGAERAAAWLTPTVQLIKVRCTWAFPEPEQPVVDGWAGAGSRVTPQVENLWYVAVYALAAAALTGAAFLLYRRRRTESAGDVVAVRALRPLFKYGFALCAGLALGFVTSSILGEETVAYTVTVWTVIGYFAAQMILDKSFRVFKKWPGALATAAVMIAVFLVMTFDLTGFETRVPDLADVESAEGNLYCERSGGWSGHFSLTDKDQIALFMDLHRAVIGERGGVQGADSQLHLSIIYHTKSGDIRRNYDVGVKSYGTDAPGTTAAALDAIFHDSGLNWHLYGLDGLEQDLHSSGRIVGIQYTYEAGDTETEPEDAYTFFYRNDALIIVNAQDIDAIWEAVAADFRDGAFDRANGETKAPRRSILFDWNDGTGEISHLRLSIPASAERTLRVIWELLPRTLAEQGLLKED